MMILSFENLSDLLVDQVDFDSHSLHGYYSLYHLSDVSFKICEAAYPSSAESVFRSSVIGSLSHVMVHASKMLPLVDKTLL